MMMRLIALVFLATCLYADTAPLNLPYAGVKVSYTNLKGEQKTTTIEREIKTPCLNIELSPQTMWSATYAHAEVNKACKKEFVTTKGIIQPIRFNDKIVTVGELEVLDFLKTKAQKEPSKYALIDSRPFEWYEQLTIASALSVPYDELEVNDIVSQAEYEKNLAKMGIYITNGKLDFSQAKTIILFCNGAWCSQSNQAMNILIRLGYPQEKIMWYRGGIQSWLGMSLSTINPKE